jgi:hypothetical protein
MIASLAQTYGSGTSTTVSEQLRVNLDSRATIPEPREPFVEICARQTRPPSPSRSQSGYSLWSAGGKRQRDLSVEHATPDRPKPSRPHIPIARRERRGVVVESHPALGHALDSPAAHLRRARQL